MRVSKFHYMVCFYETEWQNCPVGQREKRFVYPALLKLRELMTEEAKASPDETVYVSSRVETNVEFLLTGEAKAEIYRRIDVLA